MKGNQKFHHAQTKGNKLNYQQVKYMGFYVDYASLEKINKYLKTSQNFT